MAELGLHVHSYRFYFLNKTTRVRLFYSGDFQTTQKAKAFARQVLERYPNIDIVEIEKATERNGCKIWRVVKLYRRKDLIKVKDVKSTMYN